MVAQAPCTNEQTILFLLSISAKSTNSSNTNEKEQRFDSILGLKQGGLIQRDIPSKESVVTFAPDSTRLERPLGK